MTTILVANTVVLAGSLVLITVLTVSHFKMRKQIHEIKKDRDTRIKYYIRECERRHGDESKDSF